MIPLCLALSPLILGALHRRVVKVMWKVLPTEMGMTPLYESNFLFSKRNLEKFFVTIRHKGIFRLWSDFG